MHVIGYYSRTLSSAETRSVMDGYVIFQKQIQPMPLLADGFRHLYKIRKHISVICPDYDGPSKQSCSGLRMVSKSTGSICLDGPS